ncbi:glycosyltransferase family A protein [Roseospira visakhapatnamensis]|nr:glycosyltransferase family A protein [Roseospira visakhapatnamensis]
MTVPQGVDTVQPTLLSVLSSSLDALELIVMVPDLDTGVRAHVRGLARVDPRVRPVRAPFGDRAVVRNKGAESALGDVLVFLDAGAFLEPTALARMVTCLRAHPAVTVVRGRVEGIVIPDHDLRAAEVIADLHADDDGDVLAVRRIDWDALGGFDPALEPCSDRAWLLRILAEGGVVRAITVATLGWGRIAGQADQVLSVASDLAGVRAVDRLCRTDDRNGAGGSAVRSACRRSRAWRRRGFARALLAAGEGDRLRPLSVLAQALVIDATLALRDPLATLRTAAGALTTAVLSWRLGQIIGGVPARRAACAATP